MCQQSIVGESIRAVPGLREACGHLLLFVIEHGYSCYYCQCCCYWYHYCCCCCCCCGCGRCCCCYYCCHCHYWYLASSAQSANAKHYLAVTNGQTGLSLFLLSFVLCLLIAFDDCLLIACMFIVVNCCLLIVNFCWSFTLIVNCCLLIVCYVYCYLLFQRSWFAVRKHMTPHRTNHRLKADDCHQTSLQWNSHRPVDLDNLRRHLLLLVRIWE